MPPSNITDADDLAVAVVLTLELAKIARVLVRFDHVASITVTETAASRKSDRRRDDLCAGRLRKRGLGESSLIGV
jgi:hypothetical protein